MCFIWSNLKQYVEQKSSHLDYNKFARILHDKYRTSWGAWHNQAKNGGKRMAERITIKSNIKYMFTRVFKQSFSYICRQSHACLYCKAFQWVMISFAFLIGSFDCSWRLTLILPATCWHRGSRDLWTDDRLLEWLQCSHDFSKWRP